MKNDSGKIAYQKAKQRMNKILPKVRFDIDEHDEVTGVSAISIVDHPAIGSDFVAFGSSGERLGSAGERRYHRAKQRMERIRTSNTKL